MTVGRTRSARAPGIVVHRSTVTEADRCVTGGIPCTRPGRTMVDCAGQLTFAALCDAVDGAVCRELTDVGRIRAAAQRASRRPGRRGGATLRRALLVWSPGALPGSVAEVRLLRRLTALGLPEPQRQFDIRDPSGGFVARVDLAWPDRRVAVEYDGQRWHGPRRWGDDRRREERLRALGWRVERVVKTDLASPSGDALAPLVAALGRSWDAA